MVAFLLFLALGPSGEARAFCRLTTAMPLPGKTCAEHGAVLAWHRQCIGYSIAVRETKGLADDRIRETLDRAFDTWQAVPCNGRALGLELVQTEARGSCMAPQYNSGASNADTIMFVTDWSERDFDEDAFAVTLVWHQAKTGEIFDADMLLNETLGPLEICDGACAPDAVDLQNLVTHEVGHFLGLGHSEVATATMASHADLGEINKRDLTDDDRAALCSIYGSFPTAQCEEKDFLPNHGFASECAGSANKRAAPSCRIAVAPGAAPTHGPLVWLLVLSALALFRRGRSARAFNT